jgi:hypothetical protein
LNRTPTVAGNQQKFTASFWTKKGQSTSDRQLISFGNSTTFQIYWGNSGEELAFGSQVLGVSNPWFLSTTAKYRDPSAWYHIVVAVDTTQAVAANRAIAYVNGVQVTSYRDNSPPTLNYNTGANSTTAHSIGRREDNAQYLDGYLAEFNWIDGQQLTASSFGGTNAVTGVWEPRQYTGTYGTNGFYLPFSNITSTATLGNDFSGNGNTWTTNNISLTAGSTYDSMLDVPTQWIGYNTGDVVSVTRGNYAVWNPLGGSGVAVTDGNLRAANSATSYLGCFGSITLPTSGKYYFEAQLTANSGGSNIGNFGIAPTSTPLSGNQVGATNSASMYCGTGIAINGGTTVRGSAGLTTDVFQACYDGATGNVYLGINNTFYQSNKYFLSVNKYKK